MTPTVRLSLNYCKKSVRKIARGILLQRRQPERGDISRTHGETLFDAVRFSIPGTTPAASQLD
jgi:hypothetical protein